MHSSTFCGIRSRFLWRCWFSSCAIQSRCTRSSEVSASHRCVRMKGRVFNFPIFCAHSALSLCLFICFLFSSHKCAALALFLQFSLNHLHGQVGKSCPIFRMLKSALVCACISSRKAAIWCFSSVHGLGQAFWLPALPEWPQWKLWWLEGYMHRQQLWGKGPTKGPFLCASIW